MNYYSLLLMITKEAGTINFKVFDLTWHGIEPTIHQSRGTVTIQHCGSLFLYRLYVFCFSLQENCAINYRKFHSSFQWEIKILFWYFSPILWFGLGLWVFIVTLNNFFIYIVTNKLISGGKLTQLEQNDQRNPHPWVGFWKH